MAVVVIIGGGMGGVAAARSLGSGLDRRHRVTLIEEMPEVYFQPSLLWLMTGRRRLQDISKRTDRIRAAGTEVIRGKALTVNPLKRTVQLEDGHLLFYDQLILAPGADATIADSEELAAAGYNLFTPHGALAIRDAIGNFKRGELVLLVTSLPYKCIIAVFEAAFLLDEWLRKKGVRESVNISIHTPETFPFREAGPGASNALMSRLQERGINLYLGQRYQNVDPDKRIISFSSGKAPYDLLIYVPKHRTPGVANSCGLNDESGWIPVDPFTLETRQEGVFAIGDVNRITLPSGCNLPKGGGFAHFQALVVAENIKMKLEHKPTSRFFGGKSACMVETGATAFAVFGNFYKQKPKFMVLPESRIWLAGKWFMERLWLKDHS